MYNTNKQSKIRKVIVLCSFLFMYVIVPVADAHIKRVKSFLPEHGQVGILCITDKQFGNIELFYGKKIQGVNTPGQQLELF